MIIIGAGMAGLLAANMLREHNPLICEAKDELPDNHSALLRFKTNQIPVITGIPFKKVRVTKGIAMPDGSVSNVADIRSANQYALKCTGKVQGRSIMNLDPCERWIAPPDFIKRMATGVRVSYGTAITSSEISRLLKQKEPVISTLPLPVLLWMLGIKTSINFVWRPITTLNATIDIPECDVYQTLYWPDPKTSIYRASITGKKLIIEVSALDLAGNIPDSRSTIATVLRAFGIDAQVSHPVVQVNKFGKISSDDPERIKAAVYTLTQDYRIYSLGRFATWRQVMMDDLPDDIEFLRSLIFSRNNYDAAKRANK